MKYGAGILLMRYARTMGRADGPLRVSVVAYHYTVAEALADATHRHQGPHWICANGRPAHVPSRHGHRHSTT